MVLSPIKAQGHYFCLFFDSHLSLKRSFAIAYCLVSSDALIVEWSGPCLASYGDFTDCDCVYEACISASVAGVRGYQERKTLRVSCERSVVLADVDSSDSDGAQEAVNILQSFRNPLLNLLRILWLRYLRSTIPTAQTALSPQQASLRDNVADWSG